MILLFCRYNAGSFFANWAAVLLSLLVAQSIGLLVGSVITVPKTGQTITTIVALTNVLVCLAPQFLHSQFSTLLGPFASLDDVTCREWLSPMS